MMLLGATVKGLITLGKIEHHYDLQYIYKCVDNSRKLGPKYI